MFIFLIHYLTLWQRIDNPFRITEIDMKIIKTINFLELKV